MVPPGLGEQGGPAAGDELAGQAGVHRCLPFGSGPLAEARRALDDRQFAAAESRGAVRTHLDRIRDKSGCRRRADLTRLALQEGII
jgi:hypothetical protein